MSRTLSTVGVLVALVWPASAVAGNGGAAAPVPSSGGAVDHYRSAAPPNATPHKTAPLHGGLRLGARGGRVRHLQSLLVGLALSVRVTGVFDASTQSAVKSVSGRRDCTRQEQFRL